jgi:hypothetical protein
VSVSTTALSNAEKKPATASAAASKRTFGFGAERSSRCNLVVLIVRAAPSLSNSRAAAESALKSFLSGGVGGVCVVLVGHPLDLIKVRALNVSSLFAGAYNCRY